MQWMPVSLSARKHAEAHARSARFVQSTAKLDTSYSNLRGMHLDGIRMPRGGASTSWKMEGQTRRQRCVSRCRHRMLQNPPISFCYVL